MCLSFTCPGSKLWRGHRGNCHFYRFCYCYCCYCYHFLVISIVLVIFSPLRGGIKKKNWFFSENLRKGGRGVSPNPKFPYQKKLRFFWNFFYKGGGSHLFQKGVIIKNWEFWAIFAKKGGHIDSIKKKLRIFRIFSPNGGGGLANSKISLSEKTRPFQIAERGGGGSQNFGVFLKKNSFFFLMPPLRAPVRANKDKKKMQMYD